MNQTAANLVDLLLPDGPVRQWVISLPWELRLPVARSSALLMAVVRIAVSEIDKLLKRLGQERDVLCGATGIVATIQYFSGALNLNPHLHLLVLDGVYSTKLDGTAAVFTATRAPAQSELREVAEHVHGRVLRWLKRRGMLRKELDDERDPQAPEPLEACAQLSLRLGKLGHVDARGVA
jgi:hypothetical protein